MEGGHDFGGPLPRAAGPMTTLRGAGDRTDTIGTVPLLGKVRGTTPAVVLLSPRYAHNVGGALRACAAWGATQLWWTGSRVTLDLLAGERLPREERMKGYKSVQLYNHERPLKFFDRPGVVPVAVELLPGAENIMGFEHPAEAVYVFGPEDGGLNAALRCLCHRFVQIPSMHCLNLASAVNVVLYDRALKAARGVPHAVYADPSESLAECRGTV